MNCISIGKPAINEYIALQEFPKQGDIFSIKKKYESLGGVSATAACILGKWGVNSYYTGITGNDQYAEKVRNILQENKVNTKFMEVEFTKDTATNFIILDSKTGVSTKMLVNDPSFELTKYRYDFTPDYAILDGTDVSGTLALLNSGMAVKTFFYGRVGNHDSIQFTKRCNYNIVTELFAEQMTKENVDGSAEGYVNLYQKIVDVGGSSNYIVILNNRKILYSVNGQVKLLPEIKINVADDSSFDGVFVGAFAFATIKGLELDDAIKFANTAAGLSLSRIGAVSAIPELNDIFANTDVKDKFKDTDYVETEENKAAREFSESTPMGINVNQQQVTTPVEQPVEPQVDAFASTPVDTQNVVNEVQTPVEQPTYTQEVSTPVEQPMEQQPSVETNFFDNLNV